MKDYYSIVFGNDHKNPLGVVQSLGQAGVYSDAICWGKKTGLVASSRFSKNVWYAENAEKCIDILINKIAKQHNDAIGVITPCSDEAAVILEEHKKELDPWFVFQYSTHFSINELMKKSLQTKLAEDAGLDIPICYTLFDEKDIPNNPPFPCILKPLVSMKGAKADLRVVNNKDELLKHFREIVNHNNGIILQSYVDKEYEYLIECCRLSTGEVLAPIMVRNEINRLYPENVGLSSYHTVLPFEDEEMKKKISLMLHNMGYVGLVSIEFAKSKSSGKSVFFEFNIRNDGYNPCCTKAGSNINYYHYCDLSNTAFVLQKPKEMHILSEERHFQSFLHKYISFRQWLKDFREADGFTWYYKNDKSPFFKMIANYLAEGIKYKIIYPLRKRKK